MTRQSPKKFFFDIETGGFSGSSNPILSISWAVDQGEVQSAYSDPTPGSTISRWSENKVWQSIKKNAKKKGYSRTGEKEALLKFLNVLEGAPADTQLIGWNIGHSPFGQKTTKAGGFDIPFLITRAKEFGLERRYQKVLRKINIHDEGALWAYRIAKSVSKHGNRMVREGSLHKALYTEAIGFMKQAGKIAGEQGLRGEKEIARELSLAGKSFAGWKQESTFKLLFANDPKALELLKTAHESETDVIIQRMIMGKSSADLDEGFVKRWGRETLENKIVSSLKTIKAGGIERYSLAMAEAKKWGIAEGVEKKLRQTAMESGIPFSTVQAGGGIPVKSRIVRGKAVSEMAEKAGARGLAGALDLATPFLRGNWGKIAIGAGAATLLAIKPGAMFSGRDDAYNVIEGLPHGGQAERMRRTLTDFGSGWKGPVIAGGIAGTLVGGTYGGYKFSNWLDKRAADEKQRVIGLRRSIGGFSSVLSNKKFTLVGKSKLSRNDLIDAGFESTILTVPGAGQDEFRSYENPENRLHVYSSGDSWSMHRHQYATTKETTKRILFNETRKPFTEIFSSIGHLTNEVIPDIFSLLKRGFSGKDNAFNTIEGLPHGGMAEKKRRELTDFGSGYRGLKIGLGIGAIGLAGYSTYSHLSREDANEEGQTLRRFTKKKFSQIANKLWDIKPSKNLSKEIEEGTSESAREFRIFSKALKKYGEEVGTGHKRILIPKNILNIKNIEEDLGFVKTNVAIPEAGQTRWATWRHPDMKYHMHEHGEVFTMHLDRHEASTMAIKKMKRDRGSVSLKDRADVTWEGLPHVITEGIPGAFYYLKGRLLGSDPMLERIKEEVDPEYNKLLLGIKAAQRGMSFSGKDDFYNTIEGLPHGGMAEKKRKELTDFGSGYQGQDTSNALAYGGIAAGGALGGYLTMFPWKVRGIDIEKYPRLAKMQKAGFKHGMKIVSSSMAASIGGEEYKRKSKSAKMIGRLLFEELDPTRSVSEIRNFQGVAYIHSAGRIAGNRPSNPIMANWGNWGIGVDKLSTWKYLQERGGTEKHAETIAADEFYSGRGRKASLSDAGKRFIDEAGGVDKLVVKHRLSSLGEGVWTNAAKMPQDVAEKMLRNPNEFLLQKRIDLAAEFRVITVGDKAVYSAHRFGTPGAQKLGKLLDKLPNIPGIGKIRWNENIQPVLNKDVNKKLAAFAESAARDLPYEIGAFDIGMTKSGGFKVIEAQRSFGSITNPIVSRRIRNIITGKAGKAGVVAAVTGAGLALMGANIILGKDDAYNTIEGLRHGGMAEKMRKHHTDFGSGWRGRHIVGAGAAALGTIGAIGWGTGAWNKQSTLEHKSKQSDGKSTLGNMVTGFTIFGSMLAAPSAMAGKQAYKIAKEMGQEGAAKIGFNVFKTSMKAMVNTTLAQLKAQGQMHFNKATVANLHADGAKRNLKGYRSTVLGRAFVDPVAYIGGKAEKAIEHTSHWLSKNWIPNLKRAEPGALLLAGLSVVDAYHAGEAAYEGDVNTVASSLVKFAGMKYAYMGYVNKKEIFQWAKKQKYADLVSYGSLAVQSISGMKSAAFEAASYHVAYARTGTGIGTYYKNMGSKYTENVMNVSESFKKDLANTVENIDPKIIDKVLDKKSVRKWVKQANDNITEAKKNINTANELSEEAFTRNVGKSQKKAAETLDDVAKLTWLGSKGQEKFSTASKEKMWDVFSEAREGIRGASSTVLAGKEAATTGKFGEAITRHLQRRRGSKYKVANTIQGLRHASDSPLGGNLKSTGGLSVAEILRRNTTDFGSGWDKLRALVKSGFWNKLIRGGSAETFEGMLKSKGFQKALVEAKPGKIIGEGFFGQVRQMTGTFRGKEFNFARKIGTLEDLPASEAQIFKGLHEEGFRSSPSFYGSRVVGEKRHIDIELFQGTTLGKLPRSERTAFKQQAEETLGELHKRGIVHKDYHGGNIFIAETGSGRKEIGILDFGKAKKVSSSILEAEKVKDIAFFRKYFKRGMVPSKNVEEAFGEFAGAPSGSLAVHKVTEFVDPFAAQPPMSASQAKAILEESPIAQQASKSLSGDQKVQQLTKTSLRENDGFGAVSAKIDTDGDFFSPINLNKVVSKAEKMYSKPPVASKLKSSILEPGSQKARRRQRMQQSHKKAQVSHSVNSLRPGKRHRQQAGRLVN